MTEQSHVCPACEHRLAPDPAERTQDDRTDETIVSFWEDWALGCGDVERRKAAG